MNWLFWLLLGWLAVCAVATVAHIGKVRTKGDAVMGVVECIAVAVLIVAGWPR